MDGFTFTAELIKATAWPITTVIVFYFMRKPLFGLIPLVKKLKYKDLEMEFSKEIQNLKTEAEDAFEKRDSKNLDGNHKPIALDLVSFSPRAAIIEAWIELESAASRLAGSYWAQDGSVSLANYPKLGEYLHQCKVLNDKQLTIFNKLRELRNKSAHAESLDLGEHDARAYVEMASKLTSHIKNA